MSHEGMPEQESPVVRPEVGRERHEFIAERGPETMAREAGFEMPENAAPEVRQRKASKRLVWGLSTFMAMTAVMGAAPEAQAGERGQRVKQAASMLLWDAGNEAANASYRDEFRAQQAESSAMGAAMQRQALEQQLEQSFEYVARLSSAFEEAKAKGNEAGMRYALDKQAEAYKDQQRIMQQIARLGAVQEKSEKAAEKAEKSAKKKRLLGIGARVLGGVLQSY